MEKARIYLLGKYLNCKIQQRQQQQHKGEETGRELTSIYISNN